MSDANLITIHSYGTQMEAEIAKSALASAGIEVVIQSDSVGGMRPHIAWASGGFKMLVREEDEEVGREILALSDQPK